MRTTTGTQLKDHICRSLYDRLVIEEAVPALPWKATVQQRYPRWNRWVRLTSGQSKASTKSKAIIPLSLEEQATQAAEQAVTRERNSDPNSEWNISDFSLAELPQVLKRTRIPSDFGLGS